MFGTNVYSAWIMTGGLAGIEKTSTMDFSSTNKPFEYYNFPTAVYASVTSLYIYGHESSNTASDGFNDLYSCAATSANLLFGRS